MGWVGNNSWMDPPFFSRHLVPQNVGNIICVCYFLNIGLGPTKSQCSPHFSKQSIPGLPYLEPHRKVNATTLELFATNLKTLQKNVQLIFKPGLFAEIWVATNPGFVHGFPKDFPWISHPMDFRGGRGSGRQKTRLDPYWTPSEPKFGIGIQQGSNKRKKTRTRTSMTGKVGAICRPPAANCTSRVLR